MSSPWIDPAPNTNVSGKQTGEGSEAKPYARFSPEYPWDQKGNSPQPTCQETLEPDPRGQLSSS